MDYLVVHYTVPKLVITLFSLINYWLFINILFYLRMPDVQYFTGMSHYFDNSNRDT